MHQETVLDELRTDLLAMVRDHLSPVALRYGYTDTPLESNIKWRPLVLILGNYSSGKSTLINEFLGGDVQGTGQAPTDDSFTVITKDDDIGDDEPVRVTEVRDGKYLLGDPEFPFEALKKHGQRFTAHFRIKKVNSPFLTNLSIIDTPGMLDSITERDRGYSYQDVIGDLAQIADLILVLFDPHKAGTVREAHTSLRDTLPARTFEDRVLFVLNRIDECASLTDLLRVYGTLCWNLSQITGRKDIPMIHLTYSPRAAKLNDREMPLDIGYLQYLTNQREQLKNAILEAPRHRLDNLAAFIETHSERLGHLLEALIDYRRRWRRFRVKWAGYSLVAAMLGGAVAAGVGLLHPMAAGLGAPVLGGGIGIVALLVFLFWMMPLQRRRLRRFHRRTLEEVDSLTTIENQSRRDSWHSVRDTVVGYLERTDGRFPIHAVLQDHTNVKRVYKEGTQEVREVLNELATIRFPANGQDPENAVGELTPPPIDP